MAPTIAGSIRAALVLTLVLLVGCGGGSGGRADGGGDTPTLPDELRHDAMDALHDGAAGDARRHDGCADCLEYDIQFGDAELLPGDLDVESGDPELPFHDGEMQVGDLEIPAGDLETQSGAPDLPWRDAEFSSGDLEIPAGDAEIPAGDADLLRRDAESQLGDIETQSSDAERDSGDAGSPSDQPAGDAAAEADTQGPPPPLFDAALIRDPTTAACTFTNERTVIKDGVLVTAWNVSYVSYESLGGTLHPILIRAFAAKPVLAGGRLPGVVQAHGLGGFAAEDHATGLAARIGTFTLAYTGPGGGDAADNTSEGLPAMADNGYRLFDTLVDLRASWFWGHAVAAMRGLTCLTERDDVDATRLGMTGFSAGSVATLIVAGADDRLAAAVPLSGTFGWDVATQSPSAWQHALLREAGLTVESPEWLRLMDLVSAGALLPGTRCPVLLVNGSCDEFFPLSAHVVTYDAIGSEKRTALAANFDHGCYGLTGGESAETIEERARIHAEGGQKLWFGHWFGTDGAFERLPTAPSLLALNPMGAVTGVAAYVDAPSGGPAVEDVRIYWSNDDAFLFASAALDSQGGGLYGALVPFAVQANSVVYVDVTYRAGNLLFPTRFALSSPPSWPAGLVPHIRDMATCL